MATSTNDTTISPPKALLFDLMGTCLDWQSAISFAIACYCPDIFPPASNPELSSDSFAMRWRAAFFAEIQARFERGEAEEDIDETHRRLLDRLLAELQLEDKVDETTRKSLVESWHEQMPWVEVPEALEMLKKEFFLVVLANGTTRLQLNLMQSSGLQFHTLFSSELLQATKPGPEIYQKAMRLMKLKPSECMMVAAHAYDLRAAKSIGMSTAYIQRETEDPHEDMAVVKSEVDIFIPLDRQAKPSSAGLAILGNKLLDLKWQ